MLGCAAPCVAGVGHFGGCGGPARLLHLAVLRSPLPTPCSFEPSGTAPRSSLRARSSGVSYAEPSLRSKLRQGDPHTFGMVPASAAQQHASAQPHARTKPRPLFAAFRKAGPGQALQPVSD